MKIDNNTVKFKVREMFDYSMRNGRVEGHYASVWKKDANDSTWQWIAKYVYGMGELAYVLIEKNEVDTMENIPTRFTVDELESIKNGANLFSEE